MKLYEDVLNREVTDKINESLVCLVLDHCIKESVKRESQVLENEAGFFWV